MKSTTGRGVKNWPSSPRNVLPRNFSKASPLTSSPVFERSKRSSSFTMRRKVSSEISRRSAPVKRSSAR